LSAYDLTFLKASHPVIKTLKSSVGDANLHGNKVWDSSFVLMDYLLLDPIPKGRVVFDIGCGWGPASLFLMKEFQSRVMSIDADDSVEPYLRLHGELNELKPVFWQSKIKALKKSDLSMADTVIGGDICFWDSLATEWKTLIKRAKAAGVRQILIADPGRQPFYDLSEWAKKKYKAELWEHDIKQPMKATSYVLDIHLNPDD
jgi:predicted nicotinamide N-methyase